MVAYRGLHIGIRLPKASAECKTQPDSDIKMDAKSIQEAIVELPDKSRVPFNFNSQVAYNGVDFSKFNFRSEKDDLLMFVGMLDDFKNPKHAILAAQKADLSIDLVDGSFVYNRQYLEEGDER
jgi:hypothetical protein